MTRSELREATARAIRKAHCELWQPVTLVRPRSWDECDEMDICEAYALADAAITVIGAAVGIVADGIAKELERP